MHDSATVNEPAATMNKQSIGWKRTNLAIRTSFASGPRHVRFSRSLILLGRNNWPYTATTARQLSGFHPRQTWDYAEDWFTGGVNVIDAPPSLAHFFGSQTRAEVVRLYIG